MEGDPTKRFSSRVENYILYRPRYPEAVFELLRSECELKPDSPIADVGSGTGILSELFLRHGHPVYAVEPNREMREAAERQLAQYPQFRSIFGTAESTRLEDHCVDLVVAGQSFHWFDAAMARVEFHRVLAVRGWAALIWNDRRIEGSPFQQAYEDLLRTHGTDYEKVRHENVGPDEIQAFYGTHPHEMKVFEIAQRFDFDGLRGRCLSSSYVPMEGEPGYDAMMDTLRAIFDRFQEDGKVTFEYDTRVYYGRIILP